MNARPDIIGHRINRLLQTPPNPAGVWVKGFGEAFSVSLVAELDDGRILLVGEFDFEEFTGPVESLVAADLTESRYGVEDVEGQEIVGLADSAGEFAIGLKNGLFLTCESGPGGSFPVIYGDDEIEQPTDWAATARTDRSASMPIPGRATSGSGGFGILAVVVGLISAAQALAAAIFMPHRMVGPASQFDDITSLAIFAVVAIPFSAAMPRLRAGFLSMSGVPSQAYVLPRFVIRLVIALSLGQVVGCVLAAIAVDPRYAGLAVVSAVTCGAFSAGAWGRLKKHPRTEWEVPWWPLWRLWPRR